MRNQPLSELDDVIKIDILNVKSISSKELRNYILSLSTTADDV